MDGGGVTERVRLTDTLNGAGLGSSNSEIRPLLRGSAVAIATGFGLDGAKVLIESRLRRFGEASAGFLVGFVYV